MEKRKKRKKKSVGESFIKVILKKKQGKLRRTQ